MITSNADARTHNAKRRVLLLTASFRQFHTLFHLSNRTAKGDLIFRGDSLEVALCTIGLDDSLIAAAASCSIWPTFQALSSQRHTAAAMYITPQNLNGVRFEDETSDGRVRTYTWAPR
jgi:hypothetical protein